MPNLSLDIITFIEHPNVLNDQTLSIAQKTILRSVYGLALGAQGFEIYRRGTGRETYDAAEGQDVTIIAGRRSGKTGKLAAAVACFEAFRCHGLPAGEKGYVMLLAPTLKQARVAFDFILKYLRNSATLSKRILKTTKDEITLDNNIVIATYPCTHDGVRGRSIVAAICDEVAFWSDDLSAANPAEEIVAAIRPGMAAVRNAKLIKISTPFAKFGILWDAFNRRAESAHLVWQLSTFEMNPSIRREKVEGERRDSEEKFQREYLAQFTDSISGWIDAEILDPCVARGRHTLPRQNNTIYTAAIDPASRHDDFALVIVHQVPDGTLVVDRVSSWTGNKKAPLPFETVLAEIKSILESYQINSVVGDQFCADAIQQHLLKLGIFYEINNFGASTRAKIFSNLKHLLVQGKIQLPDNSDLLRQLRNLREEKTPRGLTDIQPSNGKDDLVIALALAASEAMLRPPALPGPELGLLDMQPSFASLGLIPAHCHLATICRNHPKCIGRGLLLTI